MKRHTIFSLLIGALSLGGLGQSAIAGWQIEWIDTFDGTGVDWNNWTAQTEANYNAEIQCYTADDTSPDKNYDVSGGTLTIIARRQMINCPGLPEIRDWSSGRLNSKDKREFQYGRLEAKIRVLDTKGGSWPAFWMLENRIAEQPIAGDNDFVNWPNPGAGEIDVWEWFSNDPGRYITNFYNTSGCSSGVDVRYSYPNGVLDVQQWNDYAIEWSANSARFYINDILVRNQNLSACPQYQEPMFVLLNVAIGGTLGGMVDPTMNQARMEVDYVAHCTATTANSATRCNESTPRAFTDITVFETVTHPDWAAWESGGGTPTVVMDADVTYGDTMEFGINGAAVAGFTTRAALGGGGAQVDLSGIEAAGTLEFDLKMTALPTMGAVDWKLKVESNLAATDAEVSLTTSRENHAAPLLNQWQHYTFDLADLAAEGLDLNAVDIVLVFPEFGMGDGAQFRLDNVRILGNPAPSPGSPPGGGSTGGSTTSSNSGGSSGGGSIDIWLLLPIGLAAVYRRLRKSLAR